MVRRVESVNSGDEASERDKHFILALRAMPQRGFSLRVAYGGLCIAKLVIVEYWPGESRGGIEGGGHYLIKETACPGRAYI